MAKTISQIPSGQLVDTNGNPSKQFTAFLQSIEKEAQSGLNLAGVDQITPGSTAFTPTAGVAKTMTVTGGGTPVIQTFLLYGATVTAQNMLDNIATIADALTKVFSNITDLQTAIAALDSRNTALENKSDEIITTMTP